MRTRLKKLGNKTRFSFQSEFKRYGYKRYRNHYSPTLLFTNVYLVDSNGKAVQRVTDHLWFNLTKGFQKLGLMKSGDLVQFNGRVSDYYKGYFTEATQHDFKLQYPTKIEFVDSSLSRPVLPDDKNAIVGLIMNLYWDFYVDNNRPIDDFCLSEFGMFTHGDNHPYGLKNAHYSAPEDDFGTEIVMDDDADDYGLDGETIRQRKRRRRLKSQGRKEDRYMKNVKQLLFKGVLTHDLLKSWYDIGGKKKAGKVVLDWIQSHVNEILDTNNNYQSLDQYQHFLKNAVVYYTQEELLH